MDAKGQLLQSQLMDLERRHTEVQLENYKMQTEKTHLVEHISQLHEQVNRIFLKQVAPFSFLASTSIKNTPNCLQSLCQVKVNSHAAITRKLVSI